MPMNPDKRLTNEEIKARLILIVGIALSFSFVAAIVSLIYGLLFVVQPLEQAPNDAEAWAVLSPMLMTLAGGLIGLLAGNGLKDKPKDPPTTPPVP
jgi:ribose/xylose/arabinose/galactoside ABC-type transport system permease subunit